MGNESFLAQALGEARVARSRGAPIVPEAAAAHAAVESAYGRSGLAINARNLFGIKARGQHTPFWSGDSVEMPTWEVIDGQRVDIIAAFRVYPTWAASFGDYGDIIRRVYRKSAAAECAFAFLAGLFLSGPLRWATDPYAYDKSARVLGVYENVLCVPAAPHPPEEMTGVRDTAVLTNLSWGDRVSVLVARKEVVLRGEFVWRVRPNRVDVRRAK